MTCHLFGADGSYVASVSDVPTPPPNIKRATIPTRRLRIEASDRVGQAALTPRLTALFERVMVLHGSNSRPVSAFYLQVSGPKLQPCEPKGPQDRRV